MVFEIDFQSGTDAEYVKAVCETDLTRHHRALLQESGCVDTNLVHDLKGIECH